MRKFRFLLLSLLSFFLLANTAFAFQVTWQPTDWRIWGRTYELNTSTDIWEASNLNPTGGNPEIPWNPGTDLPDGEYVTPVAATATEDSFGVAKILNIVETFSSPNNYLFQDSSSQELTLFYYNVDDVLLEDIGNERADLYSIGAKIDIYLDSSPDFDNALGPAARTDIDDYPTVTDDGDSDSVKVLSLEGHIRYYDGDIDKPYDVYEFGGDPTIGSFFGEAYFDVVANSGAWASLYDTDFWEVNQSAAGIDNTFADFKLSFNTLPGGGGGWALSGNGVAQANYVPEPTTFLLFGLGLLGMAGFTRRKTN